jgi:hypothetical protein
MVQFIDSSAFCGVDLTSSSIESGNERFVIEIDFVLDIIHHKLIRHFAKLSDVVIPPNIEILGASCFSRCE